MTRLICLLVLLFGSVSWGQPEIPELDAQLGVSGFPRASDQELRANGAVQWALQHLPKRGLERALLALANSEEAQERLLFLLLHRAFSVPGEAPKLYPAPEWPRSEPLESVDYLIIGSGPAGSVLAFELSRAGYSTLLLERGSLVAPGTVDTRALGFLKVGGGAVPTADSLMLLRNGQAVGGGGTVNVDLAFSPELPFVQQALHSWGLSVFGRERVARAYRWVVKEIGTRTPSQDEVNANNRILWRGAERTGLSPALYDLNTRPPGAGIHLANDKLGPAGQLLMRAIESGYPLELRWNVEVQKIRMQGGRALGVEVTEVAPDPHPAVIRSRPNEVHFIPAKNVIVSAGTLGSATILLRSELGGEQVGRGILLHPSMPLIGRFQEPIRNLEGTASTVYATDPERPFLLYECMAAGPDYASVMLFGTSQERGRLLRQFDNLGGFGVLLVDQPHPENRIELDGNGRPRVFYQLRGEDRDRLQFGVAQGVKVMLAAGAEEVYLPTTEPLDGSSRWDGHLQPLKSPVELQFVPGRTVLTSAHMQGSCKMGHDSESSVVGPDFRVWGCSNLYVCDTSIFPTSVGANPMQTAYTTAKLLADLLVQRSSE